MPGNTNQSTNVNEVIESRNWKSTSVVKRKNIETGNAVTNESVTELRVSGLAMTNYSKKIRRY